MKPHNRIKGRSGFGTQAEQLRDRIKAATAELEAIQEAIVSEISGDRLGPCSEAQRPVLGPDSASIRVLTQFRAALDRLRTMLWLCSETSASNTAGDPHRERQLARATSLLQALAPQRNPASSPACESGSFFDRLDRVIDNYMQDGRPLLEPHSRRRSKQ